MGREIMANARSRKRRGLNKEGTPTFIVDAKKKSKRKYFELPFYVHFSKDSTAEERRKYWKAYHKQRIELSKNRKFNRQNKGRQKLYRMHRCIKNLMDFSY